MAAGRGLSLWSKVKGLKGIVFVRWVPSQVTIFSFNNFTLFIKGTWGHAVFHLSGVNKARRRMMTLFSLLSKLHLTKNVGGFFFLCALGQYLHCVYSQYQIGGHWKVRQDWKHEAMKSGRQWRFTIEFLAWFCSFVLRFVNQFYYLIICSEVN